MTARDATHWTHPDEPVSRFGWTTAVCGARVNIHAGETDDQAPTCDRCRQWLSDRNDVAAEFRV